MKKTQKILAVILILAISVTGSYFLFKAKADSLTVSIDVVDGCRSTINDTTSQTIDVVAGSNTLQVTNYSRLVDQSVSGSGVPAGLTTGRNTKTTNSTVNINLGSVTARTTITFTPITSDIVDLGGEPNYCPGGANPTPSYLVINPVATPTPTPVTSTPTIKKQTASTVTPTTSPAPDTKTTAAAPTKDTKKKTAAILDQDNGIEETTSSHRKTILASVIALAILLASCLGLAYFVRTHPKHSFSRRLKRAFGRK